MTNAPAALTSQLTLSGYFVSGAVNFVLMNARQWHIEKIEQPAPSRRPLPRKSFKRTDRRGPYKPTRHTHWADAEDDWDYEEEDSLEILTTRIWNMRPSWQKRTCPRRKTMMMAMKATMMRMRRTWTQWIKAPFRKLSQPARQPSKGRPSSAKAAATKEKASQKEKGRAKASVHLIPGLRMPGRRIPPVPVVANEAVGRAMKCARTFALARMHCIRSGRMRPISIRVLTKAAAIPQLDQRGQ